MTKFFINTEWDELDGAALQNLNDRQQREFHRYKNELFEDGHSWDDAREILTGFIWDESEDD